MATIALFSLVAVSLFLLHLILSGKRIRKIWLILWGIAPVITVYLLNPAFRVYSFHSFMHAGITYRLLNGNVPPLEPLVGGHSLQYPWGAHLLAAGISKILRITPFSSLAIMNIGSLCISMALIYKISGLLLRDEKANILSAIVSIFAITVTSSRLVKFFSDRIPTEFRGVPTLMKFININTLPIGLVFFLLFLYSMISLFRNRGLLWHALLILVSVLGTGYCYPAFLPGIATSVILASVLYLLFGRTWQLDWRGRNALVVLIVMAGGLLVLRPYLYSIGAGTVSRIELFGLTSLSANILKWLLASIPILVIVLINMPSLNKRLEKRALLAIAAVIAASSVTYFLIHLPFNNEYKLLVLSTVTLGIPGGIAFSVMSERWPKILVFLIMILFLAPSFHIVNLRMTRGKDIPSTYFEDGIDVHSTDEDEDTLYSWIRENTSQDAIFVDKTLEIPVLAQRQLFVAAERRGREKGYGQVGLILRLQSGYEGSLLNTRREIAEKIYTSDETITAAEVKEIFSLSRQVYVVERSGIPINSFVQEQFSEVFSSPRGHLRLHRLNRPD